MKQAQEIVGTYLTPSSTTYVAADDKEDEGLALLGGRIRRVVAAGRAPLDLFSGVEALVKARLARDHFPRFVESAQYPRLCEALRARRELPLAELLVDARRTQFLDQFLRETAPTTTGNLRFWVDVQTTFLPLLQVTIFSPALFEQIQRAVRRLYNQFCTDSSPLVATRVPESVRRETLAKIMQLQGEPFSPPRYANLFRAAQDCVWQWLQADVYPRFRTSDLYVQLVVETENLEADHQLRRLSEHVQSKPRGSAAGLKTRNEPGGTGAAKTSASSAIVVPIINARPTLGFVTSRALPQSSCEKFTRSLAILRDGDESGNQVRGEHGIHSIGFYAVADAKSTRNNQEKRPEAQPWTAHCELFCSPDREAVAAETHPTYLVGTDHC